MKFSICCKNSFKSVGIINGPVLLKFVTSELFQGKILISGLDDSPGSIVVARGNRLVKTKVQVRLLATQLRPSRTVVLLWTIVLVSAVWGGVTVKDDMIKQR